MTTNTIKNTTNKFTDLSKQVKYSIGEIFKYEDKDVQVVEMEAEGIYHVKNLGTPFDSFWINTGESTDITNITDSE